MTRYDGRFMFPARQSAFGGSAFKKHTLATQVWCSNDLSASGTSDTLYFGKLAKGSIVTGGRIYGGRLASGASIGCSSFALCLGLDAICYSTSGTSYGATSMACGLLATNTIEFNIGPHSSVPTGTLRWESGYSIPFGAVLAIAGPLVLQADGNVYATIVGSAATGSGICANMNIELDYYAGTYT